MSRLAPYRKAIIAAVIPAIGTLATVATLLGWHYVWVPAVIAAATAFGVYQVPNKPRPVTDPMRGHP